MNTLRVYGKKNGNGEEKIIFRGLAENKEIIKKAKRTAAQHGYTITKAIRNGTLATRCGEVDVTEKYFSKEN